MHHFRVTLTVCTMAILPLSGFISNVVNVFLFISIFKSLSVFYGILALRLCQLYLLCVLRRHRTVCELGGKYILCLCVRQRQRETVTVALFLFHILYVLLSHNLHPYLLLMTQQSTIFLPYCTFEWWVYAVYI